MSAIGWLIRCVLWVLTAAVMLVCLVSATAVLLPMALIRTLIAVLTKADELLVQCGDFFSDGARTMGEIWQEWAKQT